MKKLTAIILGSLLASSMALADHPAGGKHGGKHKDRFISKLELTEEQKQPVAEILKEQWKKRKEIKQAAMEQVKPQMEALNEETRQRLAEILSEEQLQKYDKMSNKRHERMHKRSSHR